MLAATISDRSLFSIFVLRSAVAIARKEMSSRAANTHQQHVRIWSQNSRGNSFSLNTGCSGEPTSATTRTVSTAKKIDMHANRAPRLRSGMSFKRAASATIVIAKTKDRSIELVSHHDEMAAGNDFAKGRPSRKSADETMNCARWRFWKSVVPSAESEWSLAPLRGS